MAAKIMKDKEIEQTRADHKPITVAGLTFTDMGESWGDIRIDLPKNRDQEATILDARGAEELCCWLSFRFPVVREYIEKLKSEAGIPSDNKTLGQALQARIKEIRGEASGSGPHSGDATWLAEKTDLTVMTANRYLTDKAIPQTHIALKIARILGWSDTEMRKRVSDQKMRRYKEHAS